MNTPQEPRRNNGKKADQDSGVGESGLVSRLTAELAKIAGLLSSGLADPKKNPDTVLLGRMVQGLTPEIWRDLARKHDLDSWLAIPMNPDAKDSLGSVTAILDQLIYQRDHDALTGLANRRHFDNYLKQEAQRAIRNHTSLSLVLLDLDNFKGINDTYGHPCGDHVLKEIGRFLNDGHRAFELVARIGGDEFAVVLPGSSCWNTKGMLDRVCGEFSRHAMQCENSPEFTIQFSAGIAGVGPEIGYAGAEDLIKQADKALYEAKRKGKNQVCIMESAEGQGPSQCMVLSQEKKFLFTYSE